VGEVVLTGELADPKPAYAAMDVFVLPSAQPEPFGGVVLEAMAMRRPVVATAIGGSVDQVVDGETGFLVPPGDAGGWPRVGNSLEGS
jgi:glycosyltransferase involved in cell wall biosynthesis